MYGTILVTGPSSWSVLLIFGPSAVLFISQWSGVHFYRFIQGETCMYLADGIEAQMTRTRKQNFGGGNTKWEEKKLGKWATSETRMLEVMESACGEGYGSIDLNR